MTSVTSTASLFTALVLVMAVLVALALRRAGAGGRTGPLAVGVFIAAYLGLPGLLAWFGALDRYDPPPPPALFLLLALTILTVGTARSPLGTRLASGLGLATLVGYQVFRVPVELLLHRLYAEGVVPIEMTYSGRNGDIVTGITAGLLGLWLARGGSSRTVVMAWNVLGLALLVNIVTVAILATPVPFRHFTGGPPNLLPSTFPYVWLPSFLVQLALFGHLLVFRQLGGARDQPADPGGDR